MEELDKLISALEELKTFNGKTFTVGEQLRTAGREIDLPLKKRIRHTDEAALDRDAMEKAISGNIDETRIEGIVNEFVNEKILREFI